MQRVLSFAAGPAIWAGGQLLASASAGSLSAWDSFAVLERRTEAV